MTERIGLAASVDVSEDLSVLTITRGPAFLRGHTDTLLCGIGGMTAGEHSRKMLHEQLDEWIDKNIALLKEKK